MPETTSTTTTAKSPDKKVNFSETVEEDEASDPPKDPLYKSSRLKGYITLILASVINFSAARNSDVGTKHAPSEGQQAYAESVALVSCLTSIFVFCAHLDRFTCLRNVWEKAFGDGSVIELLVILFLVIWWTVATAIETTVRGIAGDGREQFNLYYSTWCCCWTSYWTLERWLVAYGWASFKAFISSWPFRAPGWIAILILSFLTLMWYLDLYSNHFQATLDAPILAQHYAEVSDAQWQWLLFVGSSTLVPSVVFIVVELFRTTSPSDTSTGNVDANNTNHNNHNNTTPDLKRQRFSMAIASPQQRPSMLAATMAGSIMTGSGRTSRQLIPQRQNPLPDKGNSAGGKGPLENILEGFCLMLLLMAWIPTVIVATTPGGAASLVGNAYFFTWATTVFVVETSIWFIHDLRKGVHSALQVKEREYQKFQTEVLQKSRALEAKRMAAGSWQNEALDDIELDDIPATARMTAPVIATTKPQHHHNATNVTTTDLSASQEEGDAHAEPTPKNRNTSVSRNLSQDATQRVHNVRARTRAVDLHDEDNGVPMPPDDPTGSTLFFEPMDDNNEKNDGTDNVEDLF